MLAVAAVTSKFPTSGTSISILYYYIGFLWRNWMKRFDWMKNPIRADVAVNIEGSHNHLSRRWRSSPSPYSLLLSTRTFWFGSWNRDRTACRTIRKLSGIASLHNYFVPALLLFLLHSWSLFCGYQKRQKLVRKTSEKKKTFPPFFEERSAEDVALNNSSFSRTLRMQDGR